MTTAKNTAENNYQTTLTNYNNKVAELETVTAQKQQAETDLATAQGTITNLNGQIDDLEADKAGLQSDLATANATVTSLTNEKETLEGQVTTLTNAKQDLQDQLDAIANGAKDPSAFDEGTTSAGKESDYDRLVFAKSNFDNCNFTKNGNDLVIEYFDDKNGTEGSETLTLTDYFTTADKIDTFVDKDGVTHSISDALNSGVTIQGSAANEEFTPTAPKEVFVVGGGNDTFNSVTEANAAGDKIQLTTGTKQSDVTYSRTFGSDDLVVNYADDKSVTLKDYFTQNKYTPKTLVADDAEFDIAADLETKGITVNGTDNADTFTPTALKETFVVSDGDYIKGGNTDADAQNAAGDKIKLPGSKSTVTYSRSATEDNDLVITYGYSHDKSITVQGYFGSDSYYPRTVIDSNNEEFNLRADVENKGLTLFGDGDDTFVPTEDTETFDVSNGDIIDVTQTTENDVAGDKIKIKGTKDQVSYTKVVHELAADDLVIHYDTDKTVTIGGYFGSGGLDVYYPDTIKAGYEEFSLDADIAEKGIMVSGEEVFNPTPAKETFVVSNGDIIDVSIAEESDVAGDKIEITGTKDQVSYTKVVHEFAADDLVIHYDTDKTVTIGGYFGSGGVIAYHPETIKPGSGSEFSLDEDIATKGITFEGTSGDDYFTPTAYKDVFMINGNDTIYAKSGAYPTSETTDDVIHLSCSKSDITYEKDGTDLIINYGTGKKVTLETFYDENSDDEPSGAKTMTVVTSEGTFRLIDDLKNKGVKQVGTDSDDKFMISEFKDILVLAGGDDTYIGSDGASYTESKMLDDTIQFDCNKSQISYARGGSYGDDLIITYPSGTLTIEYYFTDAGASSVQIVTNNGTVRIGADLEAKGYTIYTDPNESTTFTPTEEKETFAVKSGDSFAFTAENSYEKVAGDKIQLTGNRSDVSYSRESNSGDLVINYGSGNHITMNSYYSSTYYYPETLKTSDKEFSLEADIASKGVTVTGTNNPDNFTITTAKETFVVGNGDKIGYSSSVGYTDGDKIEITGTRNEVSYSVSEDDSNDLVITYDSGKTITIDEYFDESKYNPEKLKIGGSEFYIYADMMKKGLTFEASYGSDSTFTPTEYIDTFVFNGGTDKINCAKYDGVDYEPYDFSGDKIEISGYPLSDIKYSISGNPTTDGDLILTYGSGSSYSVTLKNYFANPDAGSIRLVTSDKPNGIDISSDIIIKGYVIDGGAMYKKTEGTSGNDSFKISDDAELFVANGGDDTYTYESSGGYQQSVGDKIELLGNRANVSYSKVGENDKDLKITYDGGTVTIPGYYESESNTGYCGNVKLKTADDDDFTVAADMAAKESPSGSFASNNRIATLSFDAAAWQSAGADSAMTDVAMNNPDEVNLMQIYTNNA